MSLVAWIVFVLATGYTIVDGVRRTFRTKTLEGFFAAGRSIPWWAAGLSVMATQLSAITIIGGVGMGYENGLEWVQFYFALPFAMVLLCVFFVPLYRQHPILTAYEYLERRFGPVTRSLTSAAFLVSRCLAFSIVLYAPSVVFSVMTGMPIWSTVAVLGLITTAYTVIGGIGGVVWTDVKQMFTILIGVGMCLGVLLWSTVGELSFGGLFRVLGAAGRLNAVEVYDPKWTFAPVSADAPSAAGSFWADGYNLWTGLFGTLFLFLSYFGCDQVQVQSLLTSRSSAGSKKALLLSAFTKIPLQLVVLFMGGLLFLFHALRSEPLLFNPRDEAAASKLVGPEAEALARARTAHVAATTARKEAMLQVASEDATLSEQGVARFREAALAAERARREARAVAQAAKPVAERGDKEINYIFPSFLFRELPGPVLGLMIAAIFAAAISSAAGALSSLTSTTMVDFYRRWISKGRDERASLLTSRIVMSFWGLAATVAAIGFGGGSVLEQINEIGSWFYGSILGVFLLALFVPRSGERAASAGLIGGLVSVFVVHSTWKVAFLWYNLVGCVGCVVVGTAVAFFAPRKA